MHHLWSGPSPAHITEPVLRHTSLGERPSNWLDAAVCRYGKEPVVSLRKRGARARGGSEGSHAPTSCLCSGCSGSGTVALPWVTAARASPTSLGTQTFVRRQRRSAVSGSR